MDNVFQFRDQLIEHYGSFSRSFVRIATPDIQAEVEHLAARFFRLSTAILKMLKLAKGCGNPDFSMCG
ncbi:hypothetical protein [Pseudomonas sp. zfem002]|uniref:hypothetical protein n=1 Tax=Pseudomonas sp. zfem002 TaxID=3078197 RepID=UPI0029293B0C|nr:hypothetical protein [Pseudomonas sp. zfem002]MDU9389985.1 hypothetical protein [Pseudomonas sp. zfem002]